MESDDQKKKRQEKKQGSSLTLLYIEKNKITTRVVTIPYPMKNKEQQKQRVLCI